ncbi:undecaprenyl-phosphate glucose phosphotransferase [Methylobacterium iners]|nr:undecaprenyl-phosphate glucose phosphotransferase [Methylobacterium iners]
MFQDRLPEIYESLSVPAGDRRDVWAALMPRRRRAAFRLGISAAVAMADLLTIIGSAYAVELLYFYATTGQILPEGFSTAPQISALVALIVLLTNLVREEYSIENQLSYQPHLRRTATLWLTAWAAVLVVGFATKTTHDLSRVVSIGSFLAGLPAILLVRLMMVALVRRAITAESASVNRVHLVGFEEDIARFYAHNDAESLGLRVIGTSYLRRVDPAADAAARDAQMSEDLDLAVSVVRFLRPDDVFILVPWSDVSDIERCVDAFLRVPAALHLRPGAVMERFPDLHVARVGRLSGIGIGRRPLHSGEIFLKRALDLSVALAALVLLAPLFAAVALLIKLDSPGPVFFRQKRYGFNQQPFAVYKFRSMKTERDAVFRQASRNDARITRIGAVLRRSNIDELPQLINVILGEMSLVGPRPHALAHDRSFERRIALYARRHNVKPGITGWAQVNGLRGETLTDLDMERRVSHDLHYIDNWSIWLDIQILFQTVFSPRAYRNAY